MDAPKLFPKPHENPGDLHGTCGGKDQLELTCTCPDYVIELHTRVSTATTVKRYLYCFCCTLPISRSTA